MNNRRSKKKVKKNEPLKLKNISAGKTFDLEDRKAINEALTEPVPLLKRKTRRTDILVKEENEIQKALKISKEELKKPIERNCNSNLGLKENKSKSIENKKLEESKAPIKKSTVEERKKSVSKIKSKSKSVSKNKSTKKPKRIAKKTTKPRKKNAKESDTETSSHEDEVEEEIIIKNNIGINYKQVKKEAKIVKNEEKPNNKNLKKSKPEEVNFYFRIFMQNIKNFLKIVLIKR